MVSLSLIQLPLNKDLSSILLINPVPLNKDSFITPAYIYMVSISLIQLPLYKDSFITPGSIYTVFLSLFIHSFILNISIALLQGDYSGALPIPARPKRKVFR